MSDLFEILAPRRLTEVVDIGANPIDGDPPYIEMLVAGLCRVLGFEPQQSALAALQNAKGPNERYLPDVIGSGGAYTLNVCQAPGMSSLLEPDQDTLRVFNLLPSFGEVKDRVSGVSRKLDCL